MGVIFPHVHSRSKQFYSSSFLLVITNLFAACRSCKADYVDCCQFLEDAQAAVSISKYPPMGTRSMTGQLPVFSLRPTPQEQVINETNTSASSVILMIETKGAIDEIDEITSTPGADVILIGSNDLAIELGVPGGFTTPVFRSALEAVSEACRKHDKVMGLAGVYDNHDFQDWAVNTLGVRFMLVGLDAAIIAKGAVGCINAVSKVEKSKVTGVA